MLHFSKKYYASYVPFVHFFHLQHSSIIYGSQCHKTFEYL